MPTGAAILTYDYVEDIVERRVPYRDAHLDLLRRFAADGDLAIAGATGDPPSGALFVFDGDDAAAEAAAFMAEDPYVEAGLVVSAGVEPWTVVASRMLWAGGRGAAKDPETGGIRSVEPPG
jgi:uncharacterized protein